MHKINFIWPQKLPVPLASQSLYAEEKLSEAELLPLQDPVENIPHQAGLEVIAELILPMLALKESSLGFFLLFSEASLGLDLPLWTELSVLSFGDGLKASPHLASPLHHSLQLKWGENFPCFLSLFYPFLPFVHLFISFLQLYLTFSEVNVSGDFFSNKIILQKAILPFFFFFVQKHFLNGKSEN